MLNIYFCLHIYIHLGIYLVTSGNISLAPTISSFHLCKAHRHFKITILQLYINNIYMRVSHWMNCHAGQCISEEMYTIDTMNGQFSEESSPGIHLQLKASRNGQDNSLNLRPLLKGSQKNLDTINISVCAIVPATISHQRMSIGLKNQQRSFLPGLITCTALKWK